MADRIRIAVVGLGRFGRKRLRSITSNPRQLDLTYLSDINADLAREMAKRMGCSAVDVQELLGLRDFDVALVAVPNKFHYDVVTRLLAARHDVWCEKPMAIEASMARSMVRTSIRYRKMLKVGSNARFFPNVLRAEEILRSDSSPDPTLFFRGWIGNAGEHLDLADWYKQREIIGGGTLLDNGIHLIDLIRHLVGEIRTCTSCHLYNRKWSFRGLEDNALALYELEDGEPASIHSSWTDSAGYMYFEIHGDKGLLQVDSREARAILTHKSDGGQEIREDFSSSRKKSYDLELERFVEDYNKGVHPEPTSYDGFRAVRVALASYRSNEFGRPVKAIGREDVDLLGALRKVFHLRK